MVLRKVKPGIIQVPDIRVTAKFTPEEYEQFQSSIKQLGAIAPIICVENEKGLFLVDGLHRLEEAIANKEKYVEVAVMPGDEVDVLTKNLFLDHLRGKAPVTDQIRVLKLLTEEYHLDSEAISEKTGLTRTRVEQLQKLSQLTPFILEQLDEGRLTIGKANVLTKIKDPIVQETVAHQALIYPSWTVFEFEEYVDGVLAIVRKKEEAPPPGPAEPYLFTCAFCGEKYEAHQVASPVVCVGCSGMLHMAITQAKAEAKAEAETKEK